MRLRHCLLIVALFASPSLGSSVPTYTVEWGIKPPFGPHREAPTGPFDDFLASYDHPAFDVIVVASSAGGNVVGDAYAYSLDRIFPFLWEPTDTSLSFIPFLGGAREGYVSDVNDAGLAVGWTVVGSRPEPWIYQDGHTTNLNDLIPQGPIGSAWHLSRADAIDAAGRITGIGSNGRYLLTPTAASPEPATFLGGIMGVLAMVGYGCHHTMKSRSA